MDKIERTMPVHRAKRVRHPFMKALWITILCLVMIVVGYTIALLVDAFLRTM